MGNIFRHHNFIHERDRKSLEMRKFVHSQSFLEIRFFIKKISRYDEFWAKLKIFRRALFEKFHRLLIKF